MNSIQRAYSALTCKSADDSKRIIRGIATTPSPDRMSDIVESMGLRFKNPMPLLLQHDHSSPVGLVRFQPATKKGIEFEAQLPFIVEPGVLQNRVEEAWQSVKYGLIPAVSIGFRPTAYEPLPSGGLRFTEGEVIELSLVTIPANADALITAVKRYDRERLSLLGRGVDAGVNPEAVASTKVHSVKLIKRK